MLSVNVNGGTDVSTAVVVLGTRIDDAARTVLAVTVSATKTARSVLLRGSGYLLRPSYQERGNVDS